MFAESAGKKGGDFTPASRDPTYGPNSRAGSPIFALCAGLAVVGYSFCILLRGELIREGEAFARTSVNVTKSLLFITRIL